MFIQLTFRGHDYVLTSDDRNFILAEGIQKYKDGEGNYQEKLKNPCYPATLEHAIQLLLSKAIKKSDAKSLKDLLTEFTEMKKEVHDFFL